MSTVSAAASTVRLGSPKAQLESVIEYIGLTMSELRHPNFRKIVAPWPRAFITINQRVPICCRVIKVVFYPESGSVMVVHLNNSLSHDNGAVLLLLLSLSLHLVLC